MMNLKQIGSFALGLIETKKKRRAKRRKSASYLAMPRGRKKNKTFKTLASAKRYAGRGGRVRRR